MRQWVNPTLLARLRRDSAQTRKRIHTIDIHSAAATDTLSTASSEGQGGIHLVLDPDERVEHHRAGLVQIEGVGLHAGLCGWMVGVPAVDLKGLHLCVFAGCGLAGLLLCCICFGGVRSAED